MSGSGHCWWHTEKMTPKQREQAVKSFLGLDGTKKMSAIDLAKKYKVDRQYIYKLVNKYHEKN